MIEHGPNFLRLLAIPIFALAAWTDYNVRRVDNNIWPWLIVIGVVAFFWQVNQMAPIHTADNYNTVRGMLIIASIFSIGSVVLYNIGSLGSADAKAIFTIGLIFPTGISVIVPLTGTTLPLYMNPMTPTGVTILINGFLFATIYLLLMWKNNILKGIKSISIFTASHKTPNELEKITGKLTGEDENGDTFYLDLDALRMYLRWRGTNISELTREGHEYKDPKTITRTFEVNTGSITVDKAKKFPYNMDVLHQDKDLGVDEETIEINDADEWGAETFLNSIDHDAYNTTPENLRRGLSTIVNNDTVKITPGFPFLVPIFFGIIISVTIGDLALAWIILAS